jgi:inorganic triphosphatase YgiF
MPQPRKSRATGIAEIRREAKKVAKEFKEKCTKARDERDIQISYLKNEVENLQEKHKVTREKAHKAYLKKKPILDEKRKKKAAKKRLLARKYGTINMKEFE